jgi:hypothetical protein
MAQHNQFRVPNPNQRLQTDMSCVFIVLIILRFKLFFNCALMTSAMKALQSDRSFLYVTRRARRMAQGRGIVRRKEKNLAADLSPSCQLSLQSRSEIPVLSHDSHFVVCMTARQRVKCERIRTM